ncbi:MAG: D-glycero-beta-D-manno-heptose-7-phosphate kinase [Candidatus Delongbacteria bacterium]|nr:D-glycero-beta-D-manno-heptose-7-phosphate kinase [Candidatus Delongbacteria bacterium]
MVTIDKKNYKKYITDMRTLKIGVIGDIMLDVYYWGRTERISPEAPVPVVNIIREEVKPGGAANVGLNIKTLGAEPVMFGLIGSDLNGSVFIENMLAKHIKTDCIVIDKNRPTTVKTRILASNQHVVRFDREDSENISVKTEKNLLKLIEKRIGELDAIIFQDYNKGMLTDSLIRSVIKSAKKMKVITAVDPKLKNFSAYKGADIFKPNLRETEEILNRKIYTESEIEKAGNDLMRMLDLEKLVITLSERGMAIFDKNKKMKMIPSKTTKIANVSGAGDTVIAALVSFLCAGASFEEACTIANYAASIVVEDVSIIPVDPDELKERLVKNGIISSGKTVK